MSEVIPNEIKPNEQIEWTIDVKPTYEDGYADGFERAWVTCWELFTKAKSDDK